MLNEKNQFLPNQNGGKPEWHRYSEEKPPMVMSQTPRARHQELDAKSLMPRVRRQEPEVKSQTPRARRQEPDAKSQMPKLHGKSEKSQIQHLTPKLSLLMIF